MNKLLISLFDYTGNASKPYRENGWKVIQVDKKLGIDWIKNLRKLSESIPPAYTNFIGEQLIKALNQPCT